MREYLAGAFIVLMLSGGESLEAYALRRARVSLAALAERAPRVSHIWCDGELVSIPAEAVEAGMEIVVKPGELVAVDGVVTSRVFSISEADFTCEPVPVRKSVGMQVLAGSVSLDGLLGVRASKRSKESQYAQLVHLVEKAQTRKAPIHRLADQYSVVLTIVTVGLAGLAWLLSGNSVCGPGSPCSGDTLPTHVSRADRNHVGDRSGSTQRADCKEWCLHRTSGEGRCCDI